MSDRVQALVRLILDILGLAFISVTGFMLPWAWAATGWVGYLLIGLGVFYLNWRYDRWQRSSGMS